MRLRANRVRAVRLVAEWDSVLQRTYPRPAALTRHGIESFTSSSCGLLAKSNVKRKEEGEWGGRVLYCPSPRVCPFVQIICLEKNQGAGAFMDVIDDIMENVKLLEMKTKK
jgi:hypothetical protein